ncbi:sensor histidine kinase [Nonomuraea ferruginea]
MNESHRLFVGPLGRSQLIALDLVAALSFVLVALTATVNAAGIPPWARLAIPLGLGLPLALRRVWPLPVFLFTVALAVTAVVSGAFSFAYVSPAYALYLVAVAEDRGSWLPTSTIGVLALLTGVGLVMVGGVPHPEGPAWLLGVDEALFGIAALGGAWTVGRAVRERRMYAMRHAERLAEQAVAEERLRIARELHDVVTHNVGLIAVKAGVANHVLATKPEEAHDALRVIESASRNALVEMRHLLGGAAFFGEPGPWSCAGAPRVDWSGRAGPTGWSGRGARRQHGARSGWSGDAGERDGQHVPRGATDEGWRDVGSGGRAGGGRDGPQHAKRIKLHEAKRIKLRYAGWFEFRYAGWFEFRYSGWSKFHERERIKLHHARWITFPYGGRITLHCAGPIGSCGGKWIRSQNGKWSGSRGGGRR